MRPAIRQFGVLLVVLTVLALFHSVAVASVSVSLQTDRTRLAVGESFEVQITVRGSVAKPQVMMPHIPACNLERLPDPPPNQPAAPSSNDHRERNTPGHERLSSLIGAVEKAQADALRTLAEQMSQKDLSLFDESAFDVLRQTRQQAMQALQQPRGNPTEYRFLFRVTPQRAGVLTLPPFVVQADGRTYQTKPVEIAVEPSAPAVALHPSSSSNGLASKSDQGGKIASSSLASDQTSENENAPGGWLLLAIGIAFPMAILAGVALAFLWPNRATRQQKMAAQTAISGAGGAVPDLLRLCNDPDEVWRCLSDAIRSLCDLPPGEITAQEAVEALTASGMATSLVRKADSVLRLCEQIRFAPGSAKGIPCDLAPQAQELYMELAKQSKRRIGQQPAPTKSLVAAV